MDLWPIRPLHNSLYWWRWVQRYWKQKFHLNIDINEKVQNSICSLELGISLCVLKYEIQGIPDLQPANLQFIHWVVSNVPGDKVQTKQINFFNDYMYFCHVPWGQRPWNWNQFLLYFFWRFTLETRITSTFLLSVSNWTPTTSWQVKFDQNSKHILQCFRWNVVLMQMTYIFTRLRMVLLSTQFSSLSTNNPEGKNCGKTKHQSPECLKISSSHIYDQLTISRVV